MKKKRKKNKVDSAIRKAIAQAKEATDQLARPEDLDYPFWPIIPYEED